MIRCKSSPCARGLREVCSTDELPSASIQNPARRFVICFLNCASARRFPFEDGFRLAEGRSATAEDVIEQLERFVSEERMARMRQAGFIHVMLPVQGSVLGSLSTSALPSSRVHCA